MIKELLIIMKKILIGLICSIVLFLIFIGCALLSIVISYFPYVSKIFIILTTCGLGYFVGNEVYNTWNKTRQIKNNEERKGISMKLFKTIDEKFKEIGFLKVQEDEYGVSYEKQHNSPKYLQRLDILHKSSGRHIIQSYDPYLMDDKKIGNTCVGLTMYEMDLCIKKMKQMGWKVQKF
jgi:flagellar motor component MotA